MAEERVQRRLAAILAADVVGFSRMMETDEEGTLARLKAHRAELIEPALAAHGGRLVKLTGDGALVEFASVVDAVRCAVEIQVGMAERNAAEAGERRIRFRIGVNLGDVIIDGDDIYGDGVNVAARLEALAEPDSIVVSAKVHDEVAERLDLAFDDLGEQAVKNIARPVRSFRLRPTASAPSSAASTSMSAEPLPLPDKPSIAVLAFENMSGDPDQEYFSDGISEDIITDLSKIQGLFVIARNSSFAYKGASPDLRRVGRELGVRHVLEGSVRKAGNRVRITAQLIDAQTGGHLWAERYDGDLEDIFALQDSIAAEIVSALKVSLTAGERVRVNAAPTADMAAYDLYLRGRAAIFPPSREGLARARDLLERTIARDPSFADAHALLAYVYFTAWSFMWTDGPPIEAALEMANRAVELDPGSALAHARLGWLCCADGDHDRAVSELQRAIELDPNDANSYHWLAETLNYMGEPEKGLEMCHIAMRLSPHLHGAHLGHSNLLLGWYEDAIATLNEGKARAPGFPINYLYLAVVYSVTGRDDDAQAEIARLLKIAPGLTLGVIRGRFPGYQKPVDRERHMTRLRKAGLPE